MWFFFLSMCYFIDITFIQYHTQNDTEHVFKKKKTQFRWFTKQAADYNKLLLLNLIKVYNEPNGLWQILFLFLENR